MKQSMEANKLLAEIMNDMAQYEVMGQEDKRNFDHTMLYYAVEFLLREHTNEENQKIHFLSGKEQ